MSALEALAMNVPVIAPNAGPFKFMIEDGENGLLFDVNSVKDLRKTIERIIIEPGLGSLLSQGAIKWEEKRSKSIKTFGEALKLAHDQVVRY